VIGKPIGSTAGARRTRTRRVTFPLVLVSTVSVVLAACGISGQDGLVEAEKSSTIDPSVSREDDATESSRQVSGAETAEAAVESWVTLILQERYVEACLASAPVAPPGQDVTALCGSTEAIKAVESLHDAWAKPGIRLPPDGKVEVTGVTAKGDKVTVPDTAISVDGHTLRSLELIGASGKTAAFSLTLDLLKLGGAWYVEGFQAKI
jgi:hypothetical protein